MDISGRLPRGFEINACTRALREMGGPVLDLTVSNPTRCAFPYPEAAILGALASPEVLHHGPDPRGAPAAREAIARWHGHGVRGEDLVLTASTSEAYAWLFKLLCDPGDEVLTPTPSYPLFEWLARLEGVRALPVPCWWHERWHLDLDALETACTPRTRALVAVNPNNPTGQFLSRAEWDRLAALCARRNMALIVDEVFSDFVLEAEPGRLATALEDPDPPCPVFVLSGLSKIALLPQVKLGWILARGREAGALLEPLAFLADQYLSVSASAQAAAPRLLDEARGLQGQVLERLRANLAALDRELLDRPHLSRLPVEGGWSVLLRRPAVDSDEACALRILARARVLVHPGHFFDLPMDRFLVLSLLTPEADWRRGLQALLPLLM
jgi:hypothetical protein